MSHYRLRIIIFLTHTHTSISSVCVFMNGNISIIIYKYLNQNYILPFYTAMEKKNIFLKNIEIKKKYKTLRSCRLRAANILPNHTRWQ